MGLDTTHGCWHGSYVGFNRWRRAVAEAAGMPPLDEMQGFNGDIKWESLPPSPLHLLLNHSDCDGELRWQDCKAIADELHGLKLELAEPWMRDAAQRWIDGLMLAYTQRENVEFR